MIIKNKKALFNYEVLDKYIAGIVLVGTEIKSIRQGKASLVDSYCTIYNNEIILLNSYIGKFDIAAQFNHDERRQRKLLLNKQEINKLKKGIEIKGFTIIPLSMFINEKGLCKVEIALCKGKKTYDKRETIKEKDNKRELERTLKNY